MIMNRLILTVAVVATMALVQVLSMPQLASADLIASDNFESYNLATIIGQGTAGDGWTNGYTGATSTLTVRDVVSGAMTGLGQSMRLGTTTKGTNNNAVQRGFTPQTGTVYFGLLVQTSGFDPAAVSPGDVNGDFVQMIVNNTSSTGTGRIDNTATATSGAIDTSTGSMLYQARKGGNESNSTLTHTNDVIHQMVFKVSKDGNDKYNLIDVFIDQATEGTPTVSRGATDTLLQTLSQISYVHFRFYDIEVGEYIYVDNLKVGTSYADVVSIPEPSSIVMLLAGAAALGLVAMRRRK
jgi:hypothetical protein